MELIRDEDLVTEAGKLLSGRVFAKKGEATAALRAFFKAVAK